jgi:hypothetical protein
MLEDGVKAKNGMLLERLEIGYGLRAEKAAALEAHYGENKLLVDLGKSFLD